MQDRRGIPRTSARTILAILATGALLALSLAPKPTRGQEKSPSLGRITYRPAAAPSAPAARVVGPLVASTGKAVVLVITRPEGAQIAINGQPRGVSNKDGVFREEVLLNRQYKILVRADKYVPFEETIRVASGEPQLVQAQLTPTFGALRLYNVPRNAGISLNNSRVPYQFQPGTDDVHLPEVAVGRHQVKVEHPDFVEWDAPVDVVPGFEVTVVPELVPAARLALATLPGVEVLIDGVKQGQTDAGGKLSVRTPLQPGRHEISLAKAGYVPVVRQANLARGDNALSIPELEPTPSYIEFADLLNDGLGLWDAPKSWQWQKERGAMTVHGGGLGLVKNRSFRDYDFVFNAKFTNKTGAAWALRIKNPRNYYLFVLSVKDRQLRTFIVEDGKTIPKEATPVLVDPGADTSYEIRAFVQGDRIRHYLKNQATADEELMGILVDARFPYGSVGLTTVAGEQFLVEDFFVRPYADSSSK